jgi:hypothetical protein
MSKIGYPRFKVEKNLNCDDKEKLASGHKKNNSKIVTIIFKIYFCGKVFSYFSVYYLLTNGNKK